MFLFQNYSIFLADSEGCIIHRCHVSLPMNGLRDIERIGHHWKCSIGRKSHNGRYFKELMKNYMLIQPETVSLRSSTAQAHPLRKMVSAASR